MIWKHTVQCICWSTINRYYYTAFNVQKLSTLFHGPSIDNVTMEAKERKKKKKFFFLCVCVRVCMSNVISTVASSPKPIPCSDHVVVLAYKVI